MAKKQDPMAMMVHLLALFTWIIGPIIIMKTSEDPLVIKHAREAANWQLTYTIGMAVSIVLMFIFIGFITFFALQIYNIIACVIAFSKANNGEFWEYPAAVEFFKTD